MNPWAKGEPRGSKARKSAHRRLGSYILQKFGDGSAYAKRRWSVVRRRADGTIAEWRDLVGRLEIKKRSKNTVKVVVHTARGTTTVIATRVKAGYRLSRREAEKISRKGLSQLRSWERYRKTGSTHLKRKRRRNR